ncbi:hypothetical protein Tco_0558655 [Tanacetum coccineum]
MCYQPWKSNSIPNQPVLDSCYWEEFTLGSRTFFSHKASHKASQKDPKKKVTPLLIPYGRFSKVIIYYLARNNNIHRRPESAVHHTGDDFILGNLKFYLEMVAENTKKTPQESASVQPTTRRTPPKKPTTTTPVKPSKPAPTPTKKPSKHKLPQKVRKGKPLPTWMMPDMEKAIKLSLDPAFLPQGQAPVGGVTIRDPVSETTPKLPEVVGKGKAIVTEEQVAHSLIDLSKKKRTTDQFILVRRDQTPHDSTTGTRLNLKMTHQRKVTSRVSIPVSIQGQAGSDPEKAHEALAGPDPEPIQEDQTGSNSGKLHVSFAGP